MNEDDTFRRLKRSTWEEVKDLILYPDHRLSLAEEITVLKNNGWTYEEYVKEAMRRSSKRPEVEGS